MKTPDLKALTRRVDSSQTESRSPGMTPDAINGELRSRGIIKRRIAEQLGCSPTVLNDVISKRIVSTEKQEYLAALLNKTPEKVFGHMYRPERSRSKQGQIAA